MKSVFAQNIYTIWTQTSVTEAYTGNYFLSNHTRPSDFGDVTLHYIYI